jgi:hypothetical protein
VSTLLIVRHNGDLLRKRQSRTRDKIATMEAKLRQLEQSTITGLPPFPPSLPARPPGPFPDHLTTTDSGLISHQISSWGNGSQFRKKPPLPSLPILPSKAKESKSSLSHVLYGADTKEARPPTSQKHPTSNLPGVRIICKGKDAVESTDKNDSVVVVETGDQ